MNAPSPTAISAAAVPSHPSRPRIYSANGSPGPLPGLSPPSGRSWETPPALRPTIPVGQELIHQPGVEVSIAEPDATDASFLSVRSVVYVRTGEPISDLTACYVTDTVNGGTTGLGHAPFHVSTNRWRIRSDFLLRSVRDVIIGYATDASGQKIQRFQWDGHDHQYDWTIPGADGSHLSALHQIQRSH